jgi:uncharacterized protein (DUF2249 family)
MRSGQPMVGTGSKRCKEDEKLINTVLSQRKKGYIIETRTANLAQMARTKGGGFELEMHYPLWRRVHKPIDRHCFILESLSKMIEGTSEIQNDSKRIDLIVCSSLSGRKLFDREVAISTRSVWLVVTHQGRSDVRLFGRPVHRARR